MDLFITIYFSLGILACVLIMIGFDHSDAMEIKDMSHIFLVIILLVTFVIWPLVALLAILISKQNKEKQ